MSKIDEKFYDRADEHINLSNSQVKGNVNVGEVSASMMFGLSRFNAFMSAIGCKNAIELENAKEKNIKYFTTQYEKMLRENVQDYIDNFEKYMK
ncbi:DUF3144 domain-containing protein [uncultured Maribacter sp.]|uniref:DUF3144 domain-containing protein n=1 Tax=uncultured Maribacter sp. TaxID=431308 RepID=UPI00260261E0|nr:DUF3144 domain-containing protein [uncultured Maribacter sp.]